MFLIICPIYKPLIGSVILINFVQSATAGAIHFNIPFISAPFRFFIPPRPIFPPRSRRIHNNISSALNTDRSRCISFQFNLRW